MGFYLNSKILFAVFCLICFAWLIASSDAISCDSCGRECASACGTKHFRTCCFNYLRKRSTTNSGASLSLPSSQSPSPSLSPNFIMDNTNNGGGKSSMTVTHPDNTNNNNNNADIKILTTANGIEEFLQDLLHNTKDMAEILRQTITVQKSNKKRHEYLNVDYA